MKKNQLYLQLGLNVYKLLNKMKITVFLLFVTVLGSLAAESYSQATKLTLEINNSTVKEVLNEIEKLSEFRFFYSSSVDVYRVTSVSEKNSKIYNILDNLFKNTNTEYEVIGKQIALVSRNENVKFVGTSDQQNPITGIVSDKLGQALPGVTVMIKGATQGSVTNIDGQFSISNVPEDAVLVFSFIGMTSQEIEVGSQTTINVTLEESMIGIDEVIVVGYGTQRKSDITGSIVSINKEILEEGTSANLMQTLQGRLAGMNITTQYAGAEQNATILVRGPSSLKAEGWSFNSANAPLVIVDGIPITGGLSSINTSDVESLEVLKDASSTAIYGTRASNGVILITTKRGQKGKVTIRYKGTYGVSEIVNMPNIMTGQEFYDWKLDFDRTTDDPELVFTTTELENYNNGIITDWIDLGTQLGNQMQHTFSISGGSETNQYYFSADVLQVEGVAVNDKFDRYSYRLNFEQEITDWLKFGTNSNLLYANRDGKSVSFNGAFYMNPLVSPYDENGDLNIVPWPEDVLFTNPLHSLNEDDTDREYKVISNNYFDMDIPFVKGLNYRLNTGISFRYLNRENYRGAGTSDGLFKNGVLNVDNAQYNKYVVENILSYKRKFGEHSIYFTGLYSYEMNERKSRVMKASNFPSHILGTYGANTGELIVPNDSYSKTTILSQMGRLNYNYLGKYLITGTVRRDGYSAFGEDTKFGIFPSVALGWNIGEEGFISDNISWIDNIKLRTSWGKNGNQAVGAYSTLAGTSEKNYLGGSNADQTAIGYIPGSLASPMLGWEFSTTINAGMDFSLFKGRLSGTTEVYKKESEQILQETIPAVYGISGNKRLRNVGKTEVKGIELSLNGTIISKKDFSWNAGIVFDSFKDKIISLTEGDVDDIANRWFIGEPFIVEYGYGFGGIWQENDEVIDGRKPGDVKVLDYEEDGVINVLDRQILGQYFPDFSFGLNSNFKYKKITVAMQFQGVVGSERPNSLLDLRLNWDARRNGLLIPEFWTPDNPINTYHANDYDANHPTYQVDFFEDASYVRFKNLKISYDFTNSKLNFGNFSQFNIFMNGSNLFTLTKWTGLDPEFANQTSTPLSRTYLIGVNISL